MAAESLQGLFEDALRSIYSTEKNILKHLPEMAKKTEDQDLKDAFEHHLDETRNQVERLEKIFSGLDMEAAEGDCPAIEGIADEAEMMMKKAEDASTRDAALIAAAQAVEHYEISRYGTLIAWAGELGHDGSVIDLLEETLAEEKNADAKLTEMGENRVNRKAA